MQKVFFLFPFNPNVKIIFFLSPLSLWFHILMFPEKRKRDHYNGIYQRFLGILPLLWNINTPLEKSFSCSDYISLVLHVLWCLHSCFCHCLKGFVFFSLPGNAIHDWVLIPKSLHSYIPNSAKLSAGISLERTQCDLYWTWGQTAHGLQKVSGIKHPKSDSSRIFSMCSCRTEPNQREELTASQKTHCPKYLFYVFL